jgi:hypothetical protein
VVEKKKRKVSPKGCRAKGRAAEVEIVEIFDKAGIPSQRVLGSGAFAFAKSDIKIGITLNPDGSKPPPDETPCLFRVESKNHASTPETVFPETARDVECVIAIGVKPVQEAVFKHLEQDDVSKAVIMRRSKVPPGALKAEDYNRTHAVMIGLNDFIELVKKAYGLNHPSDV